MHVPEVNQSTRPPESAGTKTKVSPLSPKLDCAVEVMTPVESDDAERVYLVAGEQPPAAPTQGTLIAVPPVGAAPE